jgi:conjugative transposon TraN protein
MSQIIITLSLLLSLLVKEEFVRAQEGPSFILTGMTAQKVPVTYNKMTNLVFPIAIRAGIKVSREVLVQKVKGVDNVIELKAARPHFAPTNLSVFGLDGRLYTFELEYANNPPVLSFTIVSAFTENLSSCYPEQSPLILTGLPVDQSTLASDAVSLAGKKGFLYRSAHIEKMRLQVAGIYLKDSLLWFVLRISNHSLIPYHPEYLRLFTVDRKRAKRTAIQEVSMEPVYEKLPAAVEGNVSFALGFASFTIARDKKLILEVAERGGGRVMTLPISCKMLLRARIPGVRNVKDSNH